LSISAALRQPCSKLDNNSHLWHNPRGFQQFSTSKFTLMLGGESMARENNATITRIATLMLAALSFSASADEPSLIDLPLESLLTMQVSSASKFSQSISEAPSAVQVITADDIRRHGWRTLEEALNSLPGIYTNQDKTYEFLGARGFLIPGDYNTRFLLLLDGQRINDNVYGQAMFGQEFALDMGLIARIEYVPGPGSSLYGANAMFGVINVITQTTDELPKQKVSVAITQDGWREGRALINRKTESGMGLTASISRGVKQGKDLFYDYAGGGQSTGLDKHDYSRLFARMNKDGFTLTAWANQRVVRPSSALFGTNFNDPTIRIEDTSTHVVAKYEKSLSDDLSVDGRLAHSRMTYVADLPYNDVTVPGNYINRDGTDGRWWSGEVRALYSGIAHHKLVVGSEFQSDANNVQLNYDVNLTSPINAPVNATESKKIYGLYAQDDWAFRDGWRLNLGLRVDHTSGHSVDTSPRLGLIWDVRDSTTIKLLGGQAYRRASSYESIYANSTLYLANPAIQPETIRNIEAVIDQKLGRGQSLVVSLFNYQLKNLIQQVPVGALSQYQNQPSITARGAETTYRLTTEAGTNFTTSLALNHTRDAMGQLVLNSPHWIAKANGSKPLGAWLLGAEVNVIGKRELDWAGTGTREVLGTQWLGNLNLIAPKWIPHLETQLRITNVFDRKVADPTSSDATFPFTPRDGRLWQLGASYEF
jgi:outer membrane receptor protein involved in Fe transport